MIVVGLTGGIASGKSFVANYLKKKKIPTHESDKFIKKIYLKKDKKFINFLLNNGFQNSIKKNKIDKNIKKKEIFSYKSKKEKLEQYLHKEVKKERGLFLKNNKKKQIVFLDIPLLLEKKLEKTCHYVCSTIAPIYIRKKRALKRAGISEELFRLIIKNQTTDKKRKEKSDYIIYTNFTKRHTCLQVDKIIYNILKQKK